MEEEMPDSPAPTQTTEIDTTYVFVRGARIDRVGNEWPATTGSDGGGVIISGPDHHGFI